MLDSVIGIGVIAFSICLLCGSVWSLIHVHGRRRRAQYTPQLRWGALAGGLVLAVAVSCIAFPAGPDTRILGLPLPVAVFQRDPSGLWLDYAGPLSPVIWVLDFLIGLGIPHALAILLDRVKHTRRKHAGAA